MDFPQRFKFEGTCADCKSVVTTIRHARKDGSLFVPRRVMECHKGQMTYVVTPVGEVHL